MGIYNRDGINYSSMLMAALKDRADTAARQAAYQEKMGKIWGDATKSVGNMIGRGIMASADSYGGNSTPTTIDEDKAELAKLEEEQQKYNEQVEQRRKFDELFNSPSAAQWKANAEYFDYNPEPQLQAQNATNYMSGYNPTYTRNYIPEQDKDWYRQQEEEQPVTYNPYSYAMQTYYRRGR